MCVCGDWEFNKIIGRVSIRALTNIIVHFAVIVIINFVCVACVSSNINDNGRQQAAAAILRVQPVNYCAGEL